MHYYLESEKTRRRWFCYELLICEVFVYSYYVDYSLRDS